MLHLNGHWRRLQSQVVPLIKKGTWSVTDQALFAGANFVLNVLLARWLEPLHYGIFTVAYALFLLVGIFHTGMLTEPMLVFGPGRFSDQLTSYFGLLFRGHARFAIAGVAALGIAGVVTRLAYSSELGGLLIALALVQPFILFMWLMRRACYVTLRPRVAASGGALYILIVLIGASVLYANGWLSAFSALALMAVASAGSSLWIVPRLGIRPFVAVDKDLAVAVWSSHRSYGKWAVATGILTWLSAQLVPIVLPIWAGLEGTAAFKALMNLTMPAIHAYVALSVLMVPMLVRARARGQFGQFMTGSLVAVTTAMGAFWLLLGFFGEPLVAFLYDGQYTSYAKYLWLVGSLPLFSGWICVLAASLKALERPDQVFWAHVGTALAVGTVGLLLMHRFGVAGGVLCQMFSTFVGACIMVYLVYLSKTGRHDRLPTGPAPLERMPETAETV